MFGSECEFERVNLTKFEMKVYEKFNSLINKVCE